MIHRALPQNTCKLEYRLKARDPRTGGAGSLRASDKEEGAERSEGGRASVGGRGRVGVRHSLGTSGPPLHRASTTRQQVEAGITNREPTRF